MPDPTTRDRLRLNLLGPVEVRQGDRMLAVAARKDRALLAIVALAQGRSIARARLAGMLWGDSLESRARDSLKQALLRLRRMQDDAGADLLVSDRQSVSLGPDVTVDALELLNAGDAPAAEAALGLRRGPFLEGLGIADPEFRDWMLAERARLDTAFAELALHQIHRAEAAGRSAAAALAARRLLAADPFNEEAVRAVMRAHLERGERRQALQFYEATRARLSASLDIEPESETAELARQIRSAPVQAAPVAAPAEGAAPAVAVLPFATIGGDPAQDYFADGLSEDIITDLGKISDIRVVARSAAFALKGRSLGAAEAAQVLGVSHVLQGSVRHEGDRVRVTARLVEGAGGQQVWANRFDRPATDLFLLQDELSRSVVEALRGALTPETGRLPLRGTQDLEAYRLFLKARSFYQRGLDRRSLGTARLLLAKAVERDPRYAGAYALLATCEFYLSMRLAPVAEAADARACRDLARRASLLDPELAEVRAAVGLAHYAEGRYAEADRELAAAARLDPDLFEPPFFLARNHRLCGNRAEAARLYARAAALRPEDYRAAGLLAEELRALGRDEEARQALEQTAERLAAAIEQHPDNTDALAFGASIHAELGRHDQAREWCRWAAVLGDDEALVPFNYNLARAHALLGEPDKAISRLERLQDAPAVVRARLETWLASDLDLACLREAPRFSRFLSRLRQRG